MALIEIVLVQDADEMDTNRFLLHLQHRHPESRPAGTKPIEWFVSDYVEDCYRIFHDKLHELRVDIHHEHEE
jgi:hypothetical protein